MLNKTENYNNKNRISLISNNSKYKKKDKDKYIVKNTNKNLINNIYIQSLAIEEILENQMNDNNTNINLKNKKIINIETNIKKKGSFNMIRSLRILKEISSNFN